MGWSRVMVNIDPSLTYIETVSSRTAEETGVSRKTTDLWQADKLKEYIYLFFLATNLNHWHSFWI